MKDLLLGITAFIFAVYVFFIVSFGIAQGYDHGYRYCEPNPELNRLEYYSGIKYFRNLGCWLNEGVQK